jgi:CHAT domain-containing protein
MRNFLNKLRKFSLAALMCAGTNMYPAYATVNTGEGIGAAELSDLNKKAIILENLLDSELDEPNRKFNFQLSESEFQRLKKSRSGLRYLIAMARMSAATNGPKFGILDYSAIEEATRRVFGEDSKEFVLLLMRKALLNLRIGEIQKNPEFIEFAAAKINADTSNTDTDRLFAYRANAIALQVVGKDEDALQNLKNAEIFIRNNAAISFAQKVDLYEDLASLLAKKGRFDEAIQAQAKTILLILDSQSRANFRIFEATWEFAYFLSQEHRQYAAMKIFDQLLNALSKEKSATTRLGELYWLTLSRLALLNGESGRHEQALILFKNSFEKIVSTSGTHSFDAIAEEINYGLEEKRSGNVNDGCRKIYAATESLDAMKLAEESLFRHAALARAECDLDKSTISGELIDEAIHKIQSLNFEMPNQSLNNQLLWKSNLLIKANFLNSNFDYAKSLAVDNINAFERSRNRSAINGNFRDFSLENQSDDEPYRDSIFYTFTELNRLLIREHQFNNLLIYSELARDRALGDAYALRKWLEALPSEGHREKILGLGREIHALDGRLSMEVGFLQRVRWEAERSLKVAERAEAIRAAAQSLGLGEPTSPALDVPALRAGLAPASAIVSIIHGGDAWWAVLLGPELAPTGIRLAGNDLGVAAQAWLRRLRGDPARAWPTIDGGLVLSDVRPANAAGPFLDMHSLGKRISEAVVTPLLDRLPGLQRLVVVADDELAGIPLQALPLGQGHVADRLVVSFAPSLATYVSAGTQPRASASGAVLLVGDLQYGAAVPQQAGHDPVSIGIAQARTHPLPASRREIDAIAAIHQGNDPTASGQDKPGTIAGARTGDAQGGAQPVRVEIWRGSAARKQRLMQAERSGELARYRVVHLATHAWASASEPASSGIALSGQAGDTPPDQALTAAELGGLRMAADLLVLSACDSGTGRYAHGRGVLGLAYASLAAGNRAALLSLWPVDDQRTADFMVRFHAHLAEGTTAATALALVQREFSASADPQRAAPATWGAFVLYGGD